MVGMAIWQVLSRGLEALGLGLVPLDSPDAAGVAENPAREDAFMCNMQVRSARHMHSALTRVVKASCPFHSFGVYGPRCRTLHKFLSISHRFLFVQEHWLAIRKVAGSWYNFNSLYPSPEVR